jgi:hypothetical protein
MHSTPLQEANRINKQRQESSLLLKDSMEKEDFCFIID